jgi:NCS1 family nucleobase:cation symporter-1
MICDYYIIRKTELDLAQLFKVDGIYKGWNQKAWIAFVVSILPVIPGFLGTIQVIDVETVGNFWMDLYSYAWFVTFFISFGLYWGLVKISK